MILWEINFWLESLLAQYSTAWQRWPWYHTPFFLAASDSKIFIIWLPIGQRKQGTFFSSNFLSVVYKPELGVSHRFQYEDTWKQKYIVKSRKRIWLHKDMFQEKNLQILTTCSSRYQLQLKFWSRNFYARPAGLLNTLRRTGTKLL